MSGVGGSAASLTVKICGLRDEATLDAALDAGADMVGFVFFAASPRAISVTQAAQLGSRAAGRAAVVALTVDADDATIEAIVRDARPSVLQLHGRESPERVATLKARYGLAVIKALGLRTRGDAEAIAAFDAVADMLLFDAPATAARPGGNGEAFDWSVLGDVRTRLPWLLAGGLRETTVAEALRATGARGLDVSSGVESAPGVKDPAVIARFVAAARSAFAGMAPFEAGIGSSGRLR